MKRSTLAISRDLEATGLTKAQSDVIAERIVETVEAQNDQLVTKDFFKAEITALEARADLKFAGVETKFASLEARLETKIADSETRITRCLIVSQLPAFFAFLSFLVGWIYFLLKR